MTPFLKQVAHYYYAGGDVSRHCFVFPNRRSMVFFKRYLSLEAAAQGRPLVCPRMLSMSDFIYTLSGLRKTSRTGLLLRLYDCYKALYKKNNGEDPEPLDDFIFWGDVLLNDFNDVDKYLCDPAKIFTNVSDFKRIQNLEEYLSPAQKEALGRFMDHFAGESPKKVKKQFLQVWEILHPLYCEFNSLLASEGLSYEGMAYRKAAGSCDMSGFSDNDLFVFVGLNALSGSEKHILTSLRDSGLATFVWDYSSEMIRDAGNKSSFFMKDNVREFPQDKGFAPDPGGLEKPRVNVLSVPSSFGQAKQIPEILARLHPDLSSTGMDTAIVLPDENLLIPVLNSIPDEIKDINVTMGYPLSGSEFWSYIHSIAEVHTHFRVKDGEKFYQHRQLKTVFSNAVFKSAVRYDSDIRDLIDRITAEARYYVSEKELCSCDFLSVLFKSCISDLTVSDADQIRAIEDFQLELIRKTAVAIADDPEMGIELDFAMDYYNAINRLRAERLAIRPQTYFRVFERISNMAGDSQPFKGEPLKGLQIMGPLEIRALDFENIIVLSANEGFFPRKSVSSSFIPPELRKGFGLPTYEYQDAVWAYYFYRMIQRARNVWMICDSRTEVSCSGEESRYIKQLEMIYGLKTERFVCVPQILPPFVLEDIEKTEEHVKTIRSSHLSASSLKKYIVCPAQFFYSVVEKLKPEEEVTGNLDAGMLGTVFHETMQELYSGKKYVSSEYIRSILSDGNRIGDIVSEKIRSQLRSFEISGKNIIYKDLVCQYVGKVLERDLEHMKDCGTDRFELLGLEMKRDFTIDGFLFRGIIDRLDSFAPGKVRVVDYKTGSVLETDRFIDDDNAAAIVKDLFGSDNDKRPLIALQMYLYDIIAHGLEECRDKEILNSIYSTVGLFTDPVTDVSESATFNSLLRERLSALLSEIADVSVPFRHSGNSEGACKYCDFKTICGR